MTGGIRVYGEAPAPPTIARLLQLTAGRLMPADASVHEDREAAAWDSFMLAWRPGGPLISIEIERPEDPDGHLVRQDIGARHPGARWVAALHLPPELDAAGWAAVDALAAALAGEGRGVAYGVPG